MRIFKGCLVCLLTIILLFSILIFLYNRKLSKEIVIDNQKTAKSFEEYKNKLKERNKILINSNIKDSIKNLAKKSDSTIQNSKKLNNILWTEFYLNQKIYEIDTLKKLNSELNEKLIQYNSDANEFNSKWLPIPNTFILTNSGFKSYETMYIDYGMDNSANMEKRKKVDHWIKTGEVIE